MRYLPLPISTIKAIKILVDENSSNLWVKNPLNNILMDISEYEYSSAIKGLGYLQAEFPHLMEFDKHIKLILKAQTRYNKL